MLMDENNLCHCAICGVNYRPEKESDTADEVRPTELTMFWITNQMQACPCCGYVNHTVAEEPPTTVNKAWLQSNSYKTCDGFSFRSPWAAQCYRYYLICQESQDLHQAMAAISHAGQVCEDVDDEENAEACFCRAAELARRQYLANSDPWVFAIWCEYLRRSSQFDAVLEATEQTDFSDASQMIRSVIAVQREGARAHNKGATMLGQ